MRDPHMALAFNYQRCSARARGIPFLLTFEEWADIWIASGKYEQRGRLAGQYVMSRHGDKGAYEVGNVAIVLGSVNRTTNTTAFKRRPPELRGVYCHRPNDKKPWMAKAGKLVIGYFRTVDEAQAARAAAVAANPDLLLVGRAAAKARRLAA